MKPLTCASTRRRLQAFYDRELAVADQIAVNAHLEWCDHCAAALDDLRMVGAALHALAPRRAMLTQDEAAVFTSTVVSRMQAEEDASIFSTLRLMFEDMHLVYAGVGAATATAVCLVLMLGMMRFATTAIIARSESSRSGEAKCSMPSTMAPHRNVATVEARPIHTRCMSSNRRDTRAVHDSYASARMRLMTSDCSPVQSSWGARAAAIRKASPTLLNRSSSAAHSSHEFRCPCVAIRSPTGSSPS